ncbi:transglycosylase SLT domain-containing protein [Streptomyces sp. NPDC021020]|uniref:transglycosylase SLT domain-containing protein n=1 Tax=Streptomyces sp. NPDC021020 TaxID=3365109 RepID=UPI0037B6B6CD
MPTNVGSVVASVVPDVSGFATQANSSLTPSVERLGRDLGQKLSRSLTGALDFSGIDAALRHSLDVAEGTATLKGRTIGQRYGRALRAAVDSELDGVQNALDVRITPVINRDAFRAVQADLDVLTRPRTVAINADADTRVAADELANLVRARTATINADADTAAASVRLAELARDRTATVHASVNASQVAQATSLVSRLTSTASSAGGAVAGLASKFALLGAGAPAVGSLVNVLAAIAPAAAIAVPAVAALGTAFGAIKVGTSGVGDALKAALNPAGTARAVGSINQVATARENAAAANQAASRAVASAERDLTTAQVSARQAQQNLNDARVQAKQDLLDLQNQLKHSALDERAAVLGVEEAKASLDKVLANPNATKLQREEAQLAYDQARQNLDDQKQKNADLQKQEAAARKAGVEGSKVVVAAKQAQAQATQDVRDKEQSLSDARAAQAKAARDGARSVAQAQASAAAQTSALDQTLNKLSPNARGFVASVKGMKPAWDSLKLGVQDRLFAGIGGRLTTVGGRVLPILRSGLTGTAGVLNTVGKNALTAVGNLARTGTLKKVFDGATSSLKPLARIPGQIVTGFAQVAVAAQPAFQRVTTAAGGVVDKLADKLAKAFTSGGLEKSVDTALDLIDELGDVGKNVFSVVSSIFQAGAGTGGGTLGVLQTVTGEIADVVSSPEVQGGLKALFDVTGQLATTVAPLLGSALKGVGVVVAEIGPPVQELIGDLGEALPGAFSQLQPLMKPVADAGRQIWRSLKPLGPLVLDIGSYVLNDLVGGLSAVVPVAADVVRLALVPITGFLGFVDRHKVLFGSVATGVLTIVAAMKLWALWQKAVALATAAWTAAQAALSAVMSANPIVLVILAVAALAAGVIYAYKHSETFRDIVQGAFKAVKDTALAVVGWFTDSFVPFFTKTIPAAFWAVIDWAKAHWPLILGIITGPVGLAAGLVIQHWREIRDGIASAWNATYSHTLGPMKTFFTSTAPGWVKSFKDSVVGFFKEAVDGVGTAWGKLEGVAKSPVKFLIQTVFNDGLRKVWNNTAAKLPGIGSIDAMTLPKGFATGGVLPGYTPGRDVHRFYSPTGGLLDLSGGEAIMRPEVTRAVGVGGINALNAAARQGGVAGVQALLGTGLPRRAFWGGGIWDDVTNNPVSNAVKGGVSTVAQGGVDLLKKGADWARGGVADLAEKTLKTLLGVSSLAISPKDATWSKIVGDVPVVLASKIVNFIRGKEDSGAGSSAALKGYTPSAGVKQWIPTVLQALALVNQPSSLLNSTLRRMQQESGGNPTIVNKWDSNWQAGHPSVGLMQVIKGTFDAYAGAYKSRGPFSYGVSVDPLANIYSSMRYALSRYGSLSKAYDRPGGYANGGYPRAGEVAWVGEEGPELVRFKRPAQVYPHQESMRLARQMSAQAVPAARQQQAPSQIVFNATTTDKPTRQTVMNALSDFNALRGPLVIPT